MEIPDQEKSRRDCLDKEQVNSLDTEVLEENGLLENQENFGPDDCGLTAAPEESAYDGDSDIIPPGVDEPSSGSGVRPDQAGEKKCQTCCRHSLLHDLKSYPFSEIRLAAVELANHTVLPPVVVEYYKQFGLDERIIKIMYQFRPPDMPPGTIGISG